MLLASSLLPTILPLAAHSRAPCSYELMQPISAARLRPAGPRYMASGLPLAQHAGNCSLSMPFGPQGTVGENYSSQIAERRPGTDFRSPPLRVWSEPEHRGTGERGRALGLELRAEHSASAVQRQCEAQSIRLMLGALRFFWRGKGACWADFWACGDSSDFGYL